MLTPIPLARAPEAEASLLSDALAAIAEERRTVAREAAIGPFRRHLARIQSYVQHAFEHEQITGLQAARLLGALVDGVVSALFEHAMDQTDLGPAEKLSIAATGGYGRGVLAPFSDVDLLFLTAEQPSPGTLRVV